MPPYVEAYPNENLTTVMPEQYRYTLPVKAGEQRLLGELTGAACATLVAEIAERHAGPVVLIAPDMQNALRHQAVILYEDERSLLLQDISSGLTYCTALDAEAAANMIGHIKDFDILVSHDEYCNQAIQQYWA